MVTSADLGTLQISSHLHLIRPHLCFLLIPIHLSTTQTPKHPFQFVYLWLRSKSIKKRRRCKHFALICSHKAVVKNRHRTICFVEVTARNKQKCNNYMLKIHVALWLFRPRSLRLICFRGKHTRNLIISKYSYQNDAKMTSRRVWFVWIWAVFFLLCTCQICGH